MVPNYGEGREYAVRRLRKEIDEASAERPQRRANRPRPSIMIPFSRDEDFVDRQALLDQMSQKCSQPGSRTALAGLGGVGKSQLAIEYAYRVRDRSPEAWVFWIYASNAARFEQSFREIAAHVKIPGLDNPETNIFQLVRDWLGDEENGPWLLILDNLDDASFLTASCVNGEGHPANMDGTNSQPLIRCLPQCQHGSILVTSRRREAASEMVEDRNIIAVGPMGKEDALKLLRTKLRQHEVDNVMDELTAALEYMPLAIVQAAAYISQKWPPCSVQQYLDKFLKNDRKKAGLLSYESGKLRRDLSAKNSILITWQISFDHIREIRPSAAHVLSLMSFCDRQGIPASLLQCGDSGGDGDGEGDSNDDDSEDGYGSSDGEDSDDGSEDDDGSSDEEFNVGFEDDIITLRNFSFITTNGDGKTFEMHRLVQLATLEWLEAHGKQDHWRHRFLKNLTERFPTGEYENWAECRALFPHAKSAATVAPKEDESLLNWAAILHNAALYAENMGNRAEAEKMGIQAMRAMKKVLGLEHPDTITSMNNLASTYWGQGRLAEAEGLQVQAMEMRKKVLGPEHPDTITSMNNLALTYRGQGRLAEAEGLEVQAMEMRKKVLGPEHPDTITSMNNLASTYRGQGRLAEAEGLEVQAMEMTKKVLGPEHPDTITSMNNLASTYRGQGRLAEAEGLEVQAMEMTKKVLGLEHPNTITIMNNLALTYRGQGRLAEAEGLQVQAMEMRKKVLGLEHPDTITSMNNLALTYRGQGRLAEAEGLQVQAMEMTKKVLGLEHPDTITSMGNLALTYWGQGRLAEAEGLQVQAMEMTKKVLGLEHPGTLTSLNNLAFTWAGQGRLDDALDLMHQCVQSRQKVLGRDHPDSTSSLAVLEKWQRRRAAQGEGERSANLV
ncbi:hypothetical protein B0T14DRAFT_437191 [Immersiella caudata]|uniref:Kinesin light chain n=1 Tax=Immersiella caudata TaxID=314043 RepID=A0AA40BU04_9PEZI|nr:hypothetical protein B0T14DRAFT_437191 [Immersiella caudata]